MAFDCATPFAILFYIDYHILLGIELYCTYTQHFVSFSVLSIRFSNMRPSDPTKHSPAYSRLIL